MHMTFFCMGRVTYHQLLFIALVKFSAKHTRPTPFLNAQMTVLYHDFYKRKTVKKNTFLSILIKYVYNPVCHNKDSNIVFLL